MKVKEALQSAASDVIPKVLAVTQDGGGKAYHMAKVCPSCGKKVVQEEGLVAFRCPNSKACSAQIEGRLIHFASKDALNMDGVGPQWISQFIKKKWVKSPSDFFNLNEGHLMKLERMGDVLAAKMIKSIQGTRKTTVARAIYALGIPGVGETLAQKMADDVKSLEGLLKVKRDHLIAIEDIGEIVADSIIKFRDENKNEIKKLSGVLEFQKVKRGVGPWAGKIFVLTGGLDSMSRSDAKAKIEALGGTSQSSVTKATSTVIVGADPGSKLDKAKKLGLPTWDEKKFLSELKRLSSRA